MTLNDRNFANNKQINSLCLLQTCEIPLQKNKCTDPPEEMKNCHAIWFIYKKIKQNKYYFLMWKCVGAMLAQCKLDSKLDFSKM